MVDSCPNKDFYSTSFTKDKNNNSLTFNQFRKRSVEDRFNKFREKRKSDNGEEGHCGQDGKVGQSITEDELLKYEINSILLNDEPVNPLDKCFRVKSSFS
jgi:transposase